MTKRYFYSIMILFSVLSYALSEVLVIDSSECAGMSGLRAHWDMAIPVTEDGKRVITDGKIKDRGATVMSWRGEEGGLEASKQGHDVVMAPNQRIYFDYYQAHPTKDEPLAIGGMTPLDSVYAYEPIRAPERCTPNIQVCSPERIVS